MNNIVLIEDDDALREGLALILANQDYRVKAYADYQQFAPFENIDTDIYLIDYRLPGLDGLSITQKLRTKKITSPIIILSASGDNLPEKAKAAGADVFVRKPFEIDFLVKLIDQYLSY